MSKIVDWAMELFGLTDEFEKDDGQVSQSALSEEEQERPRFSRPKQRTSFEKESPRETEKKQRENSGFSFAGTRSSAYQSEQNRRTKVVNMSSAASGGFSALNMVIQQPSSFADAPGIARYLKDRQPVVVNLENLDKVTAQKVVDFLGGAVFALDGRLTKVSNGIVVAVPNNMGITGSINEDFSASLFAEIDF